VNAHVGGVRVKVQAGAGPYYYDWDVLTATPGRDELETRPTDDMGCTTAESVSVIRKP
jgi:hypothetical protein